MNRCFTVLISFTVLIFGQQSLFAKTTFKYGQLVILEMQHQHHSYSLIDTLNMVILGHADHDHDHDDELPWSDSKNATDNHESKAHSHFDGNSFKVEFMNHQSADQSYVMTENIYKMIYANNHFFEFKADIFRPPIHN